MTATLRYAAAALACGLIAVFASENLFWVFPPPGLTAAELFATWIAYSLACACALSAVAWTGCSGWRGLFLGGAILGFMIEGVVVGEMYLFFPFQVVWTPLAWHALITALVLGGAQRRGGAAGLGMQVAAGAAIGGFAVYWPLDPSHWPTDGSVPATAAVLAYLVGLGLVVPAAHLVLDRIGTVPRPHGAVLLAVPAVALAVWVATGLADPDPVRLALPVMVGLTLWAMVRHGGAAPVGFGGPQGAVFRMSALVVPALVWAIATWGWQAWGGVETNAPFAIATVVGSVGLWLWCLALPRRG